MVRWDRNSDFMKEVKEQLRQEIYEKKKVSKDPDIVRDRILLWFKKYLKEVRLKQLNRLSSELFKKIKDPKDYMERQDVIVYHFTPEGKQYDIEIGDVREITDNSENKIHIPIIL